MVTGSLQEKNGKFYAVLSFYNDMGKRKQKWIYTGYLVRGNKKKATEFLESLIKEYNEQNINYSFLTVADYFKQWLKAIELNVKPNTLRGYKGNMNNHIIPYFKKNGILLHDLKPYHLEEYYNYKLNHVSGLNGNKPLSRTTIKHHHQNISKALSDAVRKNLISYNPALSAQTPRVTKYNAVFLNPSETEKLLALFKGTQIELPVTLCALYGMRRSEVLGLKWKNISFENKTLTICETVQQHIGGNYTDTPKTESSYRTLPLTDKVCELLAEKKSSQKEKSEMLGEHYYDSDYVCTWDNGKLISPNYLSKSFHKIILNSDLPQIRLHDLRHSVASNLLSHGFSIVQVSDFLGHESPNTTLKFYSHADKTSKISVANAMEKMIAI